MSDEWITANALAPPGVVEEAGGDAAFLDAYLRGAMDHLADERFGADGWDVRGYRTEDLQPDGIVGRAEYRAKSIANRS